MLDGQLARNLQLEEEHRYHDLQEMEYRKLCFELDKKFNIADDNDEDFYLNSNDDEFEIEENTIFDMDKEIDFVSPGVKGQKVKMILPIKCEKDWIIRRKK